MELLARRIDQHTPKYLSADPGGISGEIGGYENVSNDYQRQHLQQGCIHD